MSGEQPDPQRPPAGAQPPPPPPPHPGYQAPQYVQPARPPKHPKATTAMVLGIVSIAGGVSCVLPIFVSPFAWVTGARAVREIDADPGAYSGRTEANTGRIMGIVGTVLAALLVLGIVVVIVLAVSTDVFDADDDYYYDGLAGALGTLRGLPTA